MERQKLKDEVFLRMAEDLSRLSTCLDKQVGCILTTRDSIIIATGYNGAPRGIPHCTQKNFCWVERRNGDKTYCMSAHAEQNALVQCIRPQDIWTCYTTLSPCIVCVKLLANTGCQRIVFKHEHRDPKPKEFWKMKGGWLGL